MLSFFTQLVEQNYAVRVSSVESIHRFASAERGVFKIEQMDGPPLLLRVVRLDTMPMETLLGVAGALNALAAASFPAPLVQRTGEDELLAAKGDWVGLLLTFVEGESLSGSTSELAAMAETLAQLHLLEPAGLIGIEPSIPDCRYYPKEKLRLWLDNLVGVAHLIPPELERRYKSCVDAVSNVIDWPDLPVSILHSDCNPQNAIRATNGQMTFIDWDGVGFGPAILDLAYLLFFCHICQESWPTLEPNEAWISAVLRGYSAHRPLSATELGCLADAIALAECRHLARGLPLAVRGDWTRDRGLTRFHGREQIVPQIAEIALASIGESAEIR